jgi:hypothetical protein
LKPFSIMNAVMPRGPALRVGLGIDDQRVGLRPVGDPHLRAVEHIAVAVLLGAQAHRDDVGAGAGSLIASAPTCSPEISLGR